MIKASIKHGLAVHAYVWMTIHIHLLATPQFEDNIAKVFQSVGCKYVQYFNYTYKRNGTLWEGRNRATVVDIELYLLKVMCYIELNPVRENMTTHPANYPWSSYARNAVGKSGINDDWLVPHGEYLRLGKDEAERLTAYQALFKAALAGDDLKQIRESTHKGWALGSQKFIDGTEQMSKRQAVSKSIGRPKKELNRV